MSEMNERRLGNQRPWPKFYQQKSLTYFRDAARSLGWPKASYSKVGARYRKLKRNLFGHPRPS